MNESATPTPATESVVGVLSFLSLFNNRYFRFAIKNHFSFIYFKQKKTVVEIEFFKVREG